jgi:hypothetical protein
MLASWGVAATAVIVLKLDVPEPMPVWLWNLNFTLMLLIGIAGILYFCFKMLDELFYSADNRQRITGRRATPAKARPVTVKWQDR